MTKGVKYICPIFDHCYSDDTEVLTDSGWKHFPELAQEDKIATLSEEGSLEYHLPDKIIKAPWEGDLLRFYSKDGVDLLVSPNHKMYVQTEPSRRKNGEHIGWKLEAAEDCFSNTRYYKKSARNYFKRGPETISVAYREVKTEEWLEFLGYYLSEGSSTVTNRKDYIVQIRQTKDDKVLERMGHALSKVTSNKVNIRPDGRVIVNDKNLCLYLKDTFGYSYTKHIPRDILNNCSREQLLILYNALVIGDGKITPEGETGGCYYATASEKLKDDFQELQLKVGLSGDSHIAAMPGDTTTLDDGRKITCTSNLWKVSIRRKRSGTSLKSSDCVDKPSGYENFERVFYKGDIHCATVKNHVMYVRRNGKALWCGNSGYGEASRNYVLALNRAGVPITVQPHCFERNPPPVGTAEDREILKSLINKDIEYDTVIVHLTPDLVPAHAADNPGKKIISYTVWETDSLHPLWTKALLSANEVWVPCQWNVDAFKNSGVKAPIYKIPHGIDVEAFDNVDQGMFNVPGLKENGTYVFYSIMQWNARKNPEGLLRSYYNAFNGQDNVRLILKAYIGSHVPDQAQVIKDMVMAIKRDMGPLNFPPVSLVTDTLSSEQVKALHTFGDCYVALPHAEGWGLTAFEAGLAGNPVISTGAGGSTEFLNQENSFFIRAHESYVSGMGSFNQWYLGDQKWFTPDLIEASKAMVFAYRNRQGAKEKGNKLRDRIKNNFSWDEVAKKMIERLK